MARIPNIKRSKKFEELIQRLGQRGVGAGNERSLFPTLREAQVFCALYGFSRSHRLPFEAGFGTDDIASSQFESTEAGDLAQNVIYLIGLAEKQDPEILREGNEQELATIFEEYANGGLELLADELTRPGGENVPAFIQSLLVEGFFPKKSAPSLSGLEF